MTYEITIVADGTVDGVGEGVDPGIVVGLACGVRPSVMLVRVTELPHIGRVELTA